MPEIANHSVNASDQIAHNVGPAHLDITYRRSGKNDAPPVFLIMGGGAQLIHWPEPFCDDLVEAGLQVIRFDNRDAGLSTHIADAPPPDLPAVLAGDLRSVSYTMRDMAADTVALMDALGISAAHLVGASMGGQIAQIIATEFPHRVRSLVSMMSTTGDSSVGKVDPEVLRVVFGKPVGPTRDEHIQHRLMAMRTVGSTPAFPSDEAELTARIALAYDRDHDMTAFARQAIAAVATGDRTESLRRVSVPTLVIHGDADRMCDISGGRATAEAIPGSELVIIEGMGHGLPPGLRPRLASLISEFVWRIERQTDSD